MPWCLVVDVYCRGRLKCVGEARGVVAVVGGVQHRTKARHERCLALGREKIIRNTSGTCTAVVVLRNGHLFFGPYNPPEYSAGC